jgi:formimidoylglutamate deiminase
MDTPTRSYFFAHALLDDGWQAQVRMTVDARGDIASLAANATPEPGDLRLGTALPGMPNAHSHAHQRAMAGLAEKAGARGDSFWSWREAMYRHVGHLTPRHLGAIAAQLYVEMLKAGYTCVGEFQYLHHDRDGAPYAQRAEMSLRCLAAARESGIAITLLPVLYRYGGFGDAEPGAAQRRFVNDADGYAAIVDALRDACRDDADAGVGVAPHSLRAVSIDLLRSLLADVDAASLPVHIHIAEQEREVHDCVSATGRRPVALLLDELEVGANWCLVHATHMDADERERAARSAATVAVCPTTEANLGDGVFEARAWQAAGGRLAIGSDSHISVSAAEELRWLEYVQRLVRRERNVLGGDGGRSTGRVLYEWAARGGARACGRHTGVLRTGARADVVVLDGADPRLHGRGGDDLLDSYVFAGAGVHDVIVGGRQVIAAGHHPREAAIGAAYRDTINELAALA